MTPDINSIRPTSSKVYNGSNKRKDPSSPTGDITTATATVLKATPSPTTTNKRRKIEKEIPATINLFDDLHSYIYNFVDPSTKQSFRLASKEFNLIFEEDIQKKRKADKHTVRIDGLDEIFSKSKLYLFEKRLTRVLTDNTVCVLEFNSNLGDELNHLIIDIYLLPMNSKSPFFKHIAENPFIQGWRALKSEDFEQAFSYFEQSVSEGNLGVALFAVKYYLANKKEELKDLVKKLVIKAAEKSFYDPMEKFLLDQEYDETLYQELQQFPPSLHWKYLNDPTAQISLDQIFLFYQHSFPQNLLEAIYDCYIFNVNVNYKPVFDLLINSQENFPSHIMGIIGHYLETTATETTDYTLFLKRIKLAYWYYDKSLKTDTAVFSCAVKFLLEYFPTVLTFEKNAYNELVIAKMNKYFKIMLMDDTYYYALFSLIKIDQNQVEEAKQIHAKILKDEVMLTSKTLFVIAKGKRQIGEITNDKKEIRRALHILDSDLDKNFSHAELNLEKGICHELLGNREAATYYYNQAVLLPLTGHRIIQFTMKTGDLPVAKEKLSVILSIDPENNSFIETYAHICVLLGDSEAKKVLKKLDDFTYTAETFLLFANMFYRNHFHFLAKYYFKKADSIEQIMDVRTLKLWANTFTCDNENYLMLMERVSKLLLPTA